MWTPPECERERCPSSKSMFFLDVFLKLSSRSRSGVVRGRMCDDVDQFLGCKSKFDDPGPETMERGGDFYFGVEAPRLGQVAIKAPGATPGGVGGASFSLLGAWILII